LIWEIVGFVYKKSGAMIAFPIFMLQAKLNSSPVSIINKRTFTAIGKDVDASCCRKKVDISERTDRVQV
jgi:hypothetical protein